MRKKYLKQKIFLLQSVIDLKKWQISNLDIELETFKKEMNVLSQEYQMLKKRRSNEITEANNIIEKLTNDLENTKTQNISLKKENLTWFQKNEILNNQLASARNIITELNKKLYIKENTKDVKKYCSNKSEGI